MGIGGNLADHADALASSGRVEQACALLEEAARCGDAEAAFELAAWYLSGRRVKRDLAKARALFGTAAAAGHADGAGIYTAFVANGTGGRPDWTAAIALLKRLAATDPEAAKQLEVIGAMRLTEAGDPADLPTATRLSDAPHVELFRGAFTPAECRYLADAAEPLMQPALTVHPRTGQQLRDPIRTSDAASFPLAEENPAVHALNRRIAAISGLPVDHGEPLQVLRYRPGQQYRAHSDVLPGAANQRAVTVLVYLNDAYEGGATYFLANDLAVRGETGDALLFRNIRADGRPDDRAVHAGLPVTRGVKTIASRWIRAAPLDLGTGAGR